MRGFLALLALAIVPAAAAQTTPRGWEMSGLPALNFNADEGFGYGIIAQAFNYGDGTVKPYAYTIQPLLFLTTKGRRDLSVFVDAPHLLPGNWRMGLYAGREQQLATPYYGIGNTTARVEALEQEPDPYYYRYGRVGLRFNADFQHTVAGNLRVLVGTGARTSEIDQTPFDSGATLLRSQTGGADIPDGRAMTARVGLIYDTRDRETGPTRGQWIETLVQRGGKVAGGTHAFTRITGTARSYTSITSRVVWAQRVVAQNLSGAVPFYELYTIQGSFKDDEGIGGAGTVRGLPKNRFTGKGLVFANEELRWRAADFRARGRVSAVILSGFVDAGRVWERGLSADGLFADYHMGFGGGARFRYGENFVVALDVAHSKESTAPMYIGLGYSF
ncbi:MAG TPA: BamA/TamA family outer membrane protein [Gemmatimonadaceae bacterium]|nr:BamA/TamA family outer membrane protein [Gemmatimonadaceae bacterium]